MACVTRWLIVAIALELLAPPLSAQTTQSRPATTRSAVQVDIDNMLRQSAAADRESLIALAKQLVRRHGMDVVSPLVEVFVRDQHQDKPQWAVVAALAETLSPEDQRVAEDGTGIVVVAAAGLQEDPARQLLVRLAIGEFGVKSHVQGVASLYAAGLLRTHDPAKVRAAIASPLWPEKYVPRGYLLALRASLDYSQAIKDLNQRQRYLEFEKQLWCAYALVTKGNRSGTWEYRLVARTLRQRWQPQDEPFLLRIFGADDTTNEETSIACHLIDVLSVEGMAKLKAIAAGKSLKAQAASRAVKNAQWRATAPTTRPRTRAATMTPP
jgi:hypothetical protein